MKTNEKLIVLGIVSLLFFGCIGEDGSGCIGNDGSIGKRMLEQDEQLQKQSYEISRLGYALKDAQMQPNRTLEQFSFNQTQWKKYSDDRCASCHDFGFDEGVSVGEQQIGFECQRLREKISRCWCEGG